MEWIKVSERLPQELVEVMCSVYLAAMIDGEGSIIYQKHKSNRQVSIYNTEIQLINNCRKCLNILGIKNYVIYSGKKCKHGEALQLVVSGQKSLSKLFESVENYMCDRKRELFKAMMATYVYTLSKSA